MSVIVACLVRRLVGKAPCAVREQPPHKRQYGRMHMVRRTWTNCSRITAAASTILLLMGAAASADEIFSARTQITLPGSQNISSFDISYVDPVIGLYLLSDRTNKSIDVIDTTTNTLLVQLTATPAFAGATLSNNNAGPDGVITVGHREVWAGDGPSQVKVIDLFSQ
jgi:hypothetical protein